MHSKQPSKADSKALWSQKRRQVSGKTATVFSNKFQSLHIGKQFEVELQR